MSTSTACLDALKDLCARIEIVTSPKSHPPVRRTTNYADHEHSSLQNEAEVLIARLGLAPTNIGIQSSHRRRLASLSMGAATNNSSNIHPPSKKSEKDTIFSTNTATTFEKENLKDEIQDCRVLNEERPIIKRSAALIIARDMLLNSAVDSMQSQTQHEQSPTFVVMPTREVKHRRIRPRTNTPLPAASFLEERNESERIFFEPKLLPFKQRPDSVIFRVQHLHDINRYNEQEQNRSSSKFRTNEEGVFDSSEELRLKKREFQRRRYSLPTALTTSVESDGVNKSTLGIAQASNILLHPLDVANAIVHSSGSRSTALPPRPTQTRPRSCSESDGHAATLPKTRSRLSEWIKSQKTEKDRSEAGWAAAIRLCALHTKRRVFSRFFIILKRNLRCRQLEKRAAWSLVAKTFSSWRSVIVYRKWLNSLDERANQQRMLRSLFQWRNSVIERERERAKCVMYSHAFQCFKLSAALSKWKDHICCRRGAKILSSVADQIRTANFFAAWRVYCSWRAKRNAAGLAFNKNRIRAIVLPYLFRQWRYFVVDRRRIKAAGKVVADLIKRRIFRYVVSKFVLQQRQIENFLNVNGRYHRIQRALRQWRYTAKDRKRIASTIITIQDLDLRTCLRTFINRWKFNAMTSRLLAIKSLKVQSLVEYHSKSRTVILWSEKVHMLKKSREYNHQALRFRIHAVRNRIFMVWKSRAKAKIEKRLRKESVNAKMSDLKVLRALRLWRNERINHAKNVAVAELVKKRKTERLQSCFSAWADQWVHEKETGHNLELLAVLYHRVKCQKMGVEAFKMTCVHARHWRLQWNRAVVHHGFSVLSRSFRAIRDYSVRSRVLQSASHAFSAVAPRLHKYYSFYLWKRKAQLSAKTRSTLRLVMLSARIRFLRCGLTGLHMACKEEENLDRQIVTATRFRKARIMKVWAGIAAICGRIRKQFEIASVLSNRRRARRALLVWVKTTSSSLHERACYDFASNHYARRSCLLAVSRWKLNTCLSKFATGKLELASRFRLVHLLKPYFSRWREQYTSSILIRVSVDDKVVRARYKYASHCFNAWKTFARLSLQRKEVFSTSISRILTQAHLRKAFSAWMKGAWIAKIEMLKRREVKEEVFRKIQRYGRICTARKRQSEYLSIALTSGNPRTLCWARIAALYFQSIRTLEDEESSSPAVDRNVTYGFAFKCFSAWASHAKMVKQRRIKREASDAAAREYFIYFAALKGITRWRSKTQEQAVDRLGGEMAVSFRDSHILHRSIICWKQFTVSSAASVRIAQRNLLNGVLRRAFQAWALYYKKMKKESSLRPLRTAFNNWLRNSRAQRLLRMWREAEQGKVIQRNSVYPHRSIGVSAAVKLAFSEWVEIKEVNSQEKLNKEVNSQEKLVQMPHQSHLGYQEL
jgi:hypothetical protein